MTTLTDSFKGSPKVTPAPTPKVTDLDDAMSQAATELV
jgi:hypothetical protein